MLEVIRKSKKETHIFLIVFPITDSIRIFLSPPFFDTIQFKKFNIFCWCIVYYFEIRRNFFQVIIIDILERTPQNMDHTMIDLRLRIDPLYHIPKSCKPLYTEKQHILYAQFFRQFNMPS